MVEKLCEIESERRREVGLCGILVVCCSLITDILPIAYSTLADLSLSEQSLATARSLTIRNPINPRYRHDRGLVDRGRIPGLQGRKSKGHVGERDRAMEDIPLSIQSKDTSSKLYKYKYKYKGGDRDARDRDLPDDTWLEPLQALEEGQRGRQGSPIDVGEMMERGGTSSVEMMVVEKEKKVQMEMEMKKGIEGEPSKEQGMEKQFVKTPRKSEVTLQLPLSLALNKMRGNGRRCSSHPVPQQPYVINVRKQQKVLAKNSVYAEKGWLTPRKGQPSMLPRRPPGGGVV